MWAATWGRPYGSHFFRIVFYDVSRWPHGTAIRVGGHMGPPVRVVWFTAGVVPWRVGRPHGAAHTGCMVHGGCRTVACRAATWGRPYGSHFFRIVFYDVCDDHTGPPFGRTATRGRPYGLYGTRRVSYRGVLGGHMGPPLRVVLFNDSLTVGIPSDGNTGPPVRIICNIFRNDTICAFVTQNGFIITALPQFPVKCTPA